jgi:hypothetical protein
VTPLPPWANGPFELLVHAEGHLRAADDFDRRIALISFDNAIEVAITTYLTLHPIQRGDRAYQNVDVDRWLENYHSKLEFLGKELATRGLQWEVAKSHIIWVHDHRNEQYHGGNKGTPEKNVLLLVKKAALWIFGILFDVNDCEERLEDAIKSTLTPPPPQHDDDYDRAIDHEYGMIEVAEQSFYASDVLFNVDYEAYKDAGTRLCQKPSKSAATGGKE